MKLLTKELRMQLPALGTTEKQADPQVICKFFDPTGSWTWFVTEGSPTCPNHAHCDCTDPRCGQPETWKEFTFFGAVSGHEFEIGYFSLSELQAARGPFGLGIERDLYFKPTPLSKIRSQYDR